MSQQQPGDISIEWASERFVLLPQRAVYWPARETLLIADPHFGKAATFRRAGVPVPHGTTAANLKRLEESLSQTRACRLLILGDFFHHNHGRSPQTLDAIESWRRQRTELEIVLVRGNHDRHAGDPPIEWNLDCVDEPYLAYGFAFCHHPDAVPNDAPAFSGHVHPVVKLNDGPFGRMRLPCFLFGKHRAVLPAFGRFTGGHPLRLGADDRVFVVGDDQVCEVTRPGRVGV